MSLEPSVARWVTRLSSVEGRAARVNLWREAVSGSDPAEAALRIDAVARAAAAHHPQGTVAYLPLLDLPALGAGGGAAALAGVLAEARGRHLAGALLLLEYPGPGRPPSAPGLPPDPLLEGLSLGHRKAVARGARTSTLDRVRTDPDPRVVAEVLRNPRLTEAEVVAIAARRPNPERIARLLARSERWICRPAIQRALARNPHTPPQLAVGLTVLLPTPVLEEMGHEKGLHPAVGEGALEVLGWRREG